MPSLTVDFIVIENDPHSKRERQNRIGVARYRSTAQGFEQIGLDLFRSERKAWIEAHAAALLYKCPIRATKPS